MTLVKHELRQGKAALLIWTSAIAFFIVVCVAMFPQMKTRMKDFTDLFGSLGVFTAAFGMDRLSLGTLIGFYSVECGNILGIGGAVYASMLSVDMLSKEEKEHTAEFLLTHPVKRSSIVTGKLTAALMQIVVMNLILFAVSLLSIAAIGEELPIQELCLLHLAYFFMQTELAGICFGISAFLHRGSMGTGIGLAGGMYFLNILANISKDAAFLKYLTPFGYTEAADIVTDMALDGRRMALGMCFAAAGVCLAYWKYGKKDIR